MKALFEMCFKTFLKEGLCRESASKISYLLFKIIGLSKESF